MLTFVLDPAETPGQRVARVAREAVQDGPMGRYLRGERYGSFLDIWDMSEDYSRLIDAMHSGAVLAGVRTSCAVDASAVFGYAGRVLHKPWHADGSWGITSWLGMGFSHPAWQEAVPGAEPSLGDVVYRGSKTSSFGHVEIVTERLDAHAWRTVAGGGWLSEEEARGMPLEHVRLTDGTVMRETPPDGKDIFERDSLGRVPAGWWRAELAGVPTYEQILDRIRTANPHSGI